MRAEPHFGAQLQFADAVVGQAGVGVDAHGVVERSQPARPLAVRLFDKARRTVGHLRHHGNERRQRPLPTSQLRQHRAVAGPVVTQRRAGSAADAPGEQEMRTRSCD